MTLLSKNIRFAILFVEYLEMEIFIPNNFVAERTYIIETIFDEFLGLDYDLVYYDKNEYQIHLDSNKKLLIKDCFWSKFDEKKGYLYEKNIPKKILRAKNPFIVEKDIPIIYGEETFQLEKDFIYCGIDIFASAFFMLSRWEEFVIKKKDCHKRFPSELSLAQKNDFYYRPIVNEYVEMLWNMLIYLRINQQRKEKRFEIIPTHDIDFLLQYNKNLSGLKTIGGDILKRRNISMSIKSLKNYVNYKTGKSKDPFDTFDFFMNISEKNNIKSRFYFIAGRKNEYDIHYDLQSSKTKKIIEKIQKRGHIIGIHGSYKSFDNLEILRAEINNFKHLGIDIKEGRQHFLRFEQPKTWNILNDLNIKYDSTIGFTNDGGFRAGVCFEYHVFDIIRRKRLDLIERPLIAMETTIRKTHEGKEDFCDIFLLLKKTVEKYKGQFVFLWHNSNLNTFFWSEFIDFYRKIFI